MCHFEFPCKDVKSSACWSDCFFRGRRWLLQTSVLKGLGGDRPLNIYAHLRWAAGLGMRTSKWGQVLQRLRVWERWLKIPWSLGSSRSECMRQMKCDRREWWGLRKAAWCGEEGGGDSCHNNNSQYWPSARSVLGPALQLQNSLNIYSNASRWQALRGGFWTFFFFFKVMKEKAVSFEGPSYKEIKIFWWYSHQV